MSSEKDWAKREAERLLVCDFDQNPCDDEDHDFYCLSCPRRPAVAAALRKAAANERALVQAEIEALRAERDQYKRAYDYANCIRQRGEAGERSEEG